MMWEWHAAFDGRVEYDFDTGCVLIIDGRGVDELGYGRMPRTAGEIKAHRVSWAIVNGPIPAGLHVLHSCDVRRCVNPFHLSVGTHQDNMDDMDAKGRRVPPPVLYGSGRPNSVLTENDVWAIRHMLMLGLFTQAEIVRSYNVAPMTISRLARGASWRHVGANWPFEEAPTPWTEASILALLPPPLQKLREKSREPQKVERTPSSNPDTPTWRQ